MRPGGHRYGGQKGNRGGRAAGGQGAFGLPSLSLSGARQPVRCRAKAERSLEAWACSGSSEGRGRGKGPGMGARKATGEGDRARRKVRRRAGQPPCPPCPAWPRVCRGTGRVCPVRLPPRAPQSLPRPRAGRVSAPLVLVPEQPRCVPGLAVSVRLPGAVKRGYSGDGAAVQPPGVTSLKTQLFTSFSYCCRN